MNDEEKFTEWFDSLGLKNFKASEFVAYFNRYRGRVKNSVPPETLWKNMAQSIFIVDALRSHFGKSCTITSSYRSYAYNRAVGSSDGSQHPQNTALDITFNGVSPTRVFNKLKQWRDAGLFKGGLGLYTGSGFVHIDTRGRNATWGR